MVLCGWEFVRNAAKNDAIDQIVLQKQQRMKEIYSQFEVNLQKYATKYKAEINKDANFRDSFSQLCQNLGIDPMLSQKTMFSDLGFGDFYNELAMKIVDITARKRQENGGMMKIDDIIVEFEGRYKIKISKKDVQEALKQVTELGGCSILNNEYVSTSNLSVSADFNVLLEVSEQFGHVSEKLMREKKGWTKARFEASINPLRKEGLVWVDHKTKSGQPQYFFPSMMNTFIDNHANFSKFLE